jgi:kynureninase
LSLCFPRQNDLDFLLHRLKEQGIICDARKPNVIRIAPAPLYNSFQDVFNFVQALKHVLST